MRGNIKLIPILLGIVVLLGIVFVMENSKHCGNPSNFCVIPYPCDIYGATIESGFGCTCEDYWAVGGEHYQCPENPHKEIEGYEFEDPDVVWCTSEESDYSMSEKRGDQCCTEFATKIEREFLWMDWTVSGTKWICEPIKESGK